MQSVVFVVADLPGQYLGSAGDGVVTLDRNAAGNGWFVDATPLDNSEYTDAGTRLTATADGGAAGRVDALTAILHELGHAALGLDDSYAEEADDDLMYGYLTLGERRLPPAPHGTPARLASDSQSQRLDNLDAFFSSLTNNAFELRQFSLPSKLGRRASGNRRHGRG